VQLLDLGGHYLMIIKSNQPTLYGAAQLVFAEPPHPCQPRETQTRRTTDQAHGHWERRTLVTTTPLDEYLK